MVGKLLAITLIIAIKEHKAPTKSPLNKWHANNTSAEQCWLVLFQSTQGLAAVLPNNPNTTTATAELCFGNCSQIPVGFCHSVWFLMRIGIQLGPRKTGLAQHSEWRAARVCNQKKKLFNCKLLKSIIVCSLWWVKHSLKMAVFENSLFDYFNSLQRSATKNLYKERIIEKPLLL